MKKYIVILAAFLVLAGAYSLAAKPDGTPEASAPLQVVFHDTDLNTCTFMYLPGSASFQFSQPEERIRVITGGGSQTLATGLTTVEEGKTRLVEFMIRIGALPLTPDDFRDPATGEFDCTNEKLFSLL